MPLIKIKRLAWIVTFATLSGAALPAAAEVSFTDRSQALPLRQSYEGEWNHYVGGGVAMLDCNDDGLPDFFAAGGAAPSRLFVNTSEKSGDISFAEHPIASLSEVTGAYPIDIDGDDILDLVVLQDGPNTLLRGEGQCNFTAAPTAWGFQAGSEWTTSFSATFEAGQSWPTLAFGNYVDETNPGDLMDTAIKNMLAEDDVMEFENLGQQLGHKVSTLGNTAKDETLGNYLHSISNKLNAGGQLSQFEYGAVKSCLLSAGQHNVQPSAPMSMEESYEAFMDRFVD